jgi:hypothetical protein
MIDLLMIKTGDGIRLLPAGRRVISETGNQVQNCLSGGFKVACREKLSFLQEKKVLSEKNQGLVAKK